MKDFFFGSRGAATKGYGLDHRTADDVTVVTFMTEKDHARFMRGRRVRQP